MTKHLKDMETAMIRLSETATLRILYNDMEKQSPEDMFEPMACDGFTSGVQNNRNIEPETILNEVAYITNIPIDLIRGKTRKREVVYARILFAAEIYNRYGVKERTTDKYTSTLLGYTLAYVGNIIGRDHSEFLYYKSRYHDIIDLKDSGRKQDYIKINSDLTKLRERIQNEYRAENCETNINS